METGMSRRQECHGDRNVMETGMSRRQECHGDRNVMETGMSRRQECHGDRNVTETGMSRRQECHGDRNVTETGMSWRQECSATGGREVVTGNKTTVSSQRNELPRPHRSGPRGYIRHTLLTFPHADTFDTFQLTTADTHSS